MAIIDERAEFASATALSTSGTGLAAVGDVYDIGGANDIGDGEQMYVVIKVTTAVTSAGAATVSFQLVSDASGTLAADGTESKHAETQAFGKAELVAGFTTVIAVPPGAGEQYERYLGIQQNVGTAALTAGAIDAYLTLDPPTSVKSYPDAAN